MYQRSWICVGLLITAGGVAGCEATVGDADENAGTEATEDTPSGDGDATQTDGSSNPGVPNVPVGDGDSTSPSVGDGDSSAGDGDLGDGDAVGDGDGDVVAPPPPPAGSAACSSEAPGNAEGDFAENFTLLDQSGAMVSLSDYCGQVVYIPIGAMWCPGCQSSAEQIPAKMAEYGNEGFVILNLMAETSRGETPDQEALTAWADTYSITTPVLSDTDWGVWERYWPEHSTPKNLLIDRDGRLAVIGWVGSRDIDDAL